MVLTEILFLIRPGIRVLSMIILEVHLIEIVVGAPALVLVMCALGIGVVAGVTSGVVCRKAIQFGHIAHLLDWFPLNFAF